MTNTTKSILCYNKIKLKFTKNYLDVSVIADNIIKNKISRFILKAIPLNDLYHLFCNNLICIKFDDLIETNKYCS